MNYREGYDPADIIRDFRERYSVRTGNGINGPVIDEFRSIVYGYFNSFGRVLPWRDDPDPYRVVVSEIMLQQTQVDRVIAKYTEFIDRFPSIHELAAAPLDEVLKTWQGLGYNRRGLYLHRMAIQVVEENNGQIPNSPESLVQLPGIGPATASSICAFAYNMPVVFIETNIRAVYIHFFYPDEEGVPDKNIVPLVEATLDRDNPNRWYSALMDYGTMIKKLFPNPRRKSAHHSKQAPFRGSLRQIRGRILAQLLERPGLTGTSIIDLTGYEAEKVERVLESMVAEGMVSRKGAEYYIG